MYFCCAFKDHQPYDFSATTLQDFAERLAEALEEIGLEAKFATHILPKLTEAWRADSDQFNNHGTGYYSRERDAFRAFWDESVFSGSERKRANPYARKDEIGPDEVIGALRQAFDGQESPALGIVALT